MITTPQLYAQHVFNIPLPDTNNVTTYCRECGGIINNKGTEKEYSEAWASESLIFTKYDKTCEACIQSTKGSGTKALITPLKNRAVIINKDSIIPNELLEIGNDKPKPTGTKNILHKNSLTIKQAIEKIPELPVPYSIYCTIGDAREAINIFLKDIHLNYSNKKALIYVVPAMEHVEVEPDKILSLMEEIRLKAKVLEEKLKQGGGKANADYYLYKAVEEHGFNPTEKLLYNYLFKEEN